jgi:hypothetical protein
MSDMHTHILRLSVLVYVALQSHHHCRSCLKIAQSKYSGVYVLNHLDEDGAELAFPMALCPTSGEYVLPFSHILA